MLCMCVWWMVRLMLCWKCLVGCFVIMFSGLLSDWWRWWSVIGVIIWMVLVR